MRALCCTLAAAMLLAAAPAAGEPAGRVAHVHAPTSAEGPPAPGSPIELAEPVRTGPDERLISKLRNGAEVSLGAGGEMVVRALEPHPGRRDAALGLAVNDGPFLYIGGEAAADADTAVEIHTPVGQIDVNGRAVWGGRIDGGYGVLVVRGEAEVATNGGSVLLKEGEATTISDADAPPVAEIWPNAKIDRAIRAISLQDPE